MRRRDEMAPVFASKAQRSIHLPRESEWNIAVPSGEKARPFEMITPSIFFSTPLRVTR